MNELLGTLSACLFSCSVTITSHDGPNQMIPGELKARYAAFAKEGKCEQAAAEWQSSPSR